MCVCVCAGEGYLLSFHNFVIPKKIRVLLQRRGWDRGAENGEHFEMCLRPSYCENLALLIPVDKEVLIVSDLCHPGWLALYVV